MEGLNTLQTKTRQEYEQEYNNIINNEKYNDALFEECKKTNYNMHKIQVLLKLVDNINIRDNKGNSLLYVATTTGDLELVKCLVEHGADSNIINKSTEYHRDRQTTFALQEASKMCNLEFVKNLVEHGADVNFQNNDGDTALHHAVVMQNNLETIKYLIDNGANVNLQNKDGDTALHVVLYHRQKNNLETIQYFIEHNYDINLQNNTGNTVLMVASLFGWLTVVKYLVESGANINLVNKNGCTAYNIMDKHRDNIYAAVDRKDINMDVRCIGLYTNEIKEYLISLNN